MIDDNSDALLNEKQLSAWLGISLPSLQRHRANGSGPPFVQLSERRIAYRRSAVNEWLKTRTITRVGALVLTPQPSPVAGDDKRPAPASAAGSGSGQRKVLGRAL